MATVAQLLEPVLCIPTWFAPYKAVSNKVIRSGYRVNADGNVPAKPADLAAAAAKKLADDTTLPMTIRQRAARLTLPVYTLARYVTSEVGTSSVPEAIAVLQDAVNQAAKRGHNDVLRVLLYNRSTGINQGWYGPINTVSNSGRWAATTLDPTVRAIVLAQDVLDGVIPRDFNKGGANQANLLSKYFKYPQQRIRELASDRMYWTGPLPGVDHRRSMHFAPVSDVTAATSALLVDRAIRALSEPTPAWVKWPYCDGTRQSRPGLWITAGLALGAGVGATLWLTRQRTPALVVPA